MATSEISPEVRVDIVDFANDPRNSSFTIPVEFQFCDNEDEDEDEDEVEDEVEDEDEDEDEVENTSYLQKSSDTQNEGLRCPELEFNCMLDSIRQKVKSLSHSQHHRSIFRVPRRLREHNGDAYTPRIVSIGPLHYGEENLQAMEVRKIRYMQSLFQRTTDADLTFSDCSKAIFDMQHEASSYYGRSEISPTNAKHLAQILLVDGCFLLELFLQCSYSVNDTDINGDTIFVASTICSLQRDLALLENQIPFKVLECLYHLIMVQHCGKRELQEDPEQPELYLLPLGELCASFFRLELNSNLPRPCRYMHLLDLIRNCYLPTQSMMDPTGNMQALPPTLDSRRTKKRWELIHCVTKLRECGIKFVKGNSKKLFDIKFNPEGVLEIPELCINETMDSLLRNMIAFEQCDIDWTSHHITSYAVLMDYLIDSPADTEFLQHRRIIANYLGHGEEVSNIFNKISKKVFVKNFYFADLCNQINEHCDKWWPRRRESLVRGYCFSPWKFIGVFAGSILLLFAGLQTGYTMASYHHPPK